MKLGIYMGSFNPPHKGHIKVINYLLKNNYVDKILIVPTLNYWDKTNLIDIKDRINMLKYFENKNIIIDAKHNNLIYTYDLVKELEKEYQNYELSIIMGADNIINLDKWKNYRELLKYNIIVMNRNDIEINKYISKLNGNFTIINDFKSIDISSSEIRNNFNNSYLDPRVLNYIKNNNLYQKEGVIMNNNYQSEEEFLKNYNVKEFKQLSMTTDILIISVSEEENSNYRKTSEKKMSILLVKRNDYPYKDKWCLPGGFINVDNETLEDCAKRILKDETNLTNIYLEQLYTFDSIKRDPRCRVISCSYMALVDKNRLNNKINDNTCWFDIVNISDKNNLVTIKLDNGKEIIDFKIKKELRELSNNQFDYEIVDNKYIAFDHPLVILTGIERLKNKINYTDIVFNMMPKYFTLGELQRVYEVILGKKLLDPAFRRIIKDKVIKTNKIKTGAGHRPSVLFTYNNKL